MIDLYTIYSTEATHPHTTNITIVRSLPQAQVVPTNVRALLNVANEPVVRVISFQPMLRSFDQSSI